MDMGAMERDIQAKVSGMTTAELGTFLDSAIAEHAVAVQDTADAIKEAHGVIAILQEADKDLTEAGEEIAGMLLHDPPTDEEIAALGVKE